MNQLWFSTEPNATLQFSRAQVSGAPLPGGALPLRPLPQRAERPGRLVLWRAALRMLGAHPLTGVGPDNFRLIYGRYTTLQDADPRVHSNNMYLEVLAGSGLLGGVVFGWLCWRAAALPAPPRAARRRPSGGVRSRGRCRRGGDRAARARRFVPELHARLTS